MHVEIGCQDTGKLSETDQRAWMGETLVLCGEGF